MFPALRLTAPILLLLVSACAVPSTPAPEPRAVPFFVPVTRAVTPNLYPGETRKTRKLVNTWADHYDVPRSLVHRVIQRESDYRAGARNGPYYGMMQILPATAGTMGFSGAPNDLLDANTNLKYAVKYLRGAWLLSNGSEAQAVQWYAKGYYYEARNRCMLRATGLRETEVRKHCG
jgi:soluble lytic murein transglycosylase-like protein